LVREAWQAGEIHVDLKNKDTPLDVLIVDFGFEMNIIPHSVFDCFISSEIYEHGFIAGFLWLEKLGKQMS
jgi:hypothetical protein